MIATMIKVSVSSEVVGARLEKLLKTDFIINTEKLYPRANFRRASNFSWTYLRNARVTAFTVSELLRENQHRGKITPHPYLG